MNELLYAGKKPSNWQRSQMSLHVVFAIGLMLMASAMCFAQGTRGTIRGEITDPNGAAVAGATIKLINVARNQEVRTATSDQSGVYQIVEVDPASYEVVITASGFAEARISNVTVEPNRNVRLDPVQLGISTATAVVEVSAAEQLVDKESGTLGTTVETKRVEGLPLNGRNILDLALLQPGITTTSTGTIR